MVSTEVVVVTGAARGIGATIAERLSTSGRYVVLVDRDAAVLDTAAAIRELGGAARGCVAEITSTEGRDNVLQTTAWDRRDLVALVNNAGITRDAQIHEMTSAQFADVVRVNLGGAYEMCALLAPYIRTGGAIVNVSSRAVLGSVGQFNYACAKAGIVALTRALALQWGPRLRVNAVAPGLTATQMVKTIPQEVLSKMVDKVPLKRMAEPDEIAAAVEFLQSEESRYLTGQTLMVCGGRSLKYR